MNPSPSVSVIIPCFNDGRFLTEALKSVVCQTLQPIEILVINDGSTDLKTIKLLQKIDTMGVKVIHQENSGLGGARNTGIRKARGKYTYFCDADNVLYPECLATLAHLMEAQDDAIAATSRIRILGGPMRGTMCVNHAIPIYSWSVTNGTRASCCATKRLEGTIFIMTKQDDVTVTKIGSSTSGSPKQESRFCFVLPHFINIAFATILCLPKRAKAI
jgi:glycosyltransferase involved in cell wall biosynthesis